jgi:small subunit ribosomal protein S5
MSDQNTNIPDTEAVVTAVPETTTEVVAETAPVVEAQTTTSSPDTSSADTVVEAAPVAPVTAAPVVEQAARPAYAPRAAGSARPPFKKRTPGVGGPGGRGGARAPRPERVKPEFDQKILDIRRVVRVVSGGRRFSFSVAIAIGDKNGRVGLGSGKSSDTSLAIEKALKDAKKKMITLKLTKGGSIAHDLNAKFASSKVFIMPNRGRGLIAGSSARVLLNLAGVKDVTAKFFSGSKNKLNNGKVTMAALETIAYKYGEERIASKVAMVETETSNKAE